MTEPGPWGPTGPYPDSVDSSAAGPAQYQPVPNYGEPQPAPARNHTALMITAVIAVVAVLTAVAVVVIQQTRSGSPTATNQSAAADEPVPAKELRSVRITGPNLLTKPGSSQPLATLTVYEDFLCPYCGMFEGQYAPTIKKLIDAGQIGVDYTMVSILGQGNPKSYSVRAGAVAYCIGDVDKGAFQRFHAALFAQQPDETATVFPTDAQLLEQAHQAGAGASVDRCVKNGKYLAMVNHAVENAGIQGTPTVELNGKDISDDLMATSDPQTLVDKVKAITGNKQ